ncbi:unnamed protein product [Rotaria sp. Silwood1]|nr:unnamed protein product [Rotaria sp. Silwood1]CAF1357445.1 unnamed protein product [Rotaria sp. Silwood1]CAF3556446.1 unnamed protein product [Rotaria sp. Silwood1]CAF3587745.1 unnamed protein product [Rotaria sp. Silwood1]CAF3607759.1 unnamed protein product [Rotaria sp. Silwood1]
MNSATMQQFNGFEKLHVTGPFDIEPETQIVYSIDGDIEQSSIVTIRRMPESMRPRENPLIEPLANNLTVILPDSSAFVQFKLMKILKPQSDINQHIPETSICDVTTINLDKTLVEMQQRTHNSNIDYPAININVANDNEQQW